MSKLDDVIDLRDNFFEEQERLYLGMVNQINTQMRELLKNDLGIQFVHNCARDFSGEIVRMLPVGKTGNMYVTADQMLDRILHFSYDNDIDPLSSNDQLRKDFYNNENRQELDKIIKENELSQKKLFLEPRNKDKLDQEARKKYRENMEKNGVVYDEITGVKDERERKVKGVIKSDMEVEHAQARANAQYNSIYIKEKGIEELKRTIHSPDNLYMMHYVPNSIKRDIKVYELDGMTDINQIKEYLDKKFTTESEKINYIANNRKDITYKATPEEIVDALCTRLEGETDLEKITSKHRYKAGYKYREEKGEESRKILKKVGYLDDEGKIKPEVKKKLIKRYRKSMNKESMVVFKNADYGKISHTALKKTANAFYAILAGQLMYYGIPPVIYETKLIIAKKVDDLDSFYVKIKKAFKRVINYMMSKMKDMISNVAHNSLKTFLRNFFDIIIEMMKATVKRVMQMIKQVVMALVNSIKILEDKNRTAAEKADAVFTTLGITISGIVVNVVIEYLEKQFPFIKPFSDPLQIIITIMTTNIVMLILQEMDIFNVRYGLMLKRIEEIFEEERKEYKTQLKKLEEDTYTNIDKLIDEVEMDMFDIITNITSLDVNEYDMKHEIDKINKIFNMGIDLEEEWNQFVAN